MNKYLAFLVFIFCIGKVNAKEILTSGYYGDNISIVNNNGVVYGQFEYYDKWNETIGTFENICKLYFYGHLNSSDTIYLKVGLPAGGFSDGKLILHKNHSITLFTSFENNGYGIEDFKNHGYSCIFSKPIENSIGQGIVKDKKCHLYADHNDTSITKGYLIDGDFVLILQKAGNWVQIKYVAPFSGKAVIRWIKNDSLYDANPAKWNK